MQSLFCLAQIITKWSLKIFTNETTTLLPWNVQAFVAIRIMENNGNSLWNGAQFASVLMTLRTWLQPNYVFILNTFTPICLHILSLGFPRGAVVTVINASTHEYCAITLGYIMQYEINHVRVWSFENVSPLRNHSWAVELFNCVQKSRSSSNLDQHFFLPRAWILFDEIKWYSVLLNPVFSTLSTRK